MIFKPCYEQLSIMVKSEGIFRIGTSNIVVPVPKYAFPPAYREKTRLTYYASLFNSLEVNSTFYKLPRPVTFEKWISEVPDDFQFTIKLWRDITHAKGLVIDPALTERFMETAQRLGAKKGCLLVQFPASITVHFINAIQSLLEQLQQLDPANTWRKSFEFRHNTWYTPVVYNLLEQFDATLVLQDMPKCKTPDIEHVADFIYLRYHGPESGYRGSYHPEHLEAEAAQIKDWLKEGKDVYAYFNNTAGDAFNNAMMLRGYVEGAGIFDM